MGQISGLNERQVMWRDVVNMTQKLLGKQAVSMTLLDQFEHTLNHAIKHWEGLPYKENCGATVHYDELRGQLDIKLTPTFKAWLENRK